jgi:hypothetical protein
VRAIGVSNFREHELRELIASAREPPHVVQSWLDPLHQASRQETDARISESKANWIRLNLAAPRAETPAPRPAAPRSEAPTAGEAERPAM